TLTLTRSLSDRCRLRQVTLEVGRVEAAAGLGGAGGGSRDEAGAAEAIEALPRRARASMEHRPRGFDEGRIAGEYAAEAAEVVAEDPGIVLRLALDRADIAVAARERVQPAAHEVRLTSDQVIEARQFRVVSQGRAIAAVEIRHLLGCEIGERDL